MIDIDHPRAGGLALATCVAAAAAAYVHPWSLLVMSLAAYLLGRAPASRRLSTVTFVAVLALVAAYAAMTWTDPEVWSAIAVTGVLLGLVPWLTGRHLAARARLTEVERDLAESIERREHDRLNRAHARERSLIAREMHDTLGHELSLIALRAGALEVGAGATTSDQSSAAGELRAAATRATEQLNHIVGVLATDSVASPVTALPLTITDLVRQARSAGMDVELDVDDPSLAQVSPVTEQTVLRTVQEGLTNAAKHAAGAHVRVRVETAGPVVRLSVADDGTDRPVATVAPGGRGLAALRERTEYLGGHLHVTDHDAGFELASEVPHDPRLPTGDDDDETDGVPEQLIDLRRRSRRSLMSAFLVPLAALLVVAVCLTSWFVYVTIASVVSAREYAEIRVGAPQDQVESVLPAVEMLEAPTDRLPTPEGAQCRYHEGSVSFFERRSVYRICFADGVVVTKDEIAATP